MKSKYATKSPAHFGEVRCPCLFVQGTRDALCDLQLLEAHLLGPDWPQRHLHVVEGGDHSFKVLKRAGRSEASIISEVVSRTTAFCRRVDDGG